MHCFVLTIRLFNRDLHRRIDIDVSKNEQENNGNEKQTIDHDLAL